MSFDLELSASSFPIFFHQTVNPCLNKIAFYIHPQQLKIDSLYSIQYKQPLIQSKFN